MLALAAAKYGFLTFQNGRTVENSFKYLQHLYITILNTSLWTTVWWKPHNCRHLFVEI